MKCEPTQTPEAVEIDIPALRERYRRERERRLRVEGQAQYLRPARGAVGDPAVDPYRAVEPRPALSEEIDVAVLGGGFTGILAAVNLRKAGVTSFRNIEHAGTKCQRFGAKRVDQPPPKV